VTLDLVALKAAAFDASGAGLEIRGPDGARLIANAAATEEIGVIGPEPRAERLVGGRAKLIEARGFAFAGADYRVVAAIDNDAQRRLQDDLFARAYFDASTGLPNRALFDRAVAEMIASRPDTAPFAAVVVEIDKFSEIVAFHGGAASEELASRIGERLSRSVGVNDLVARTNSDEFCVLVGEPGAIGDFAGGCETWVKRANEPYLVDGVEIFVHACAGACFWPTGEASAQDLRRKARAAAREARRASACVRLFEAGVERRERARAKEENALRQAIRDRRIGCAFQPKVDFRADTVDSLEVLMRWRDDDGEWSPPGNFLNLAHEIGLTNEITDLVFEETLRSLDAVNEAFGPDPRIGFNIAARQACDTRFMRDFLERLAASGHAPRFVLEITEEAFVPSARFQERILPMIRAAGAGVSIDDFGSGFSSLAAVADIVADEIKVDRSLVTDIDKRPRSQSMLKAIESIGEALATEVVVEGVETEAEFRYLRDCTRLRVAQGYYFGRPLMLTGAGVAPVRRREGRGI
jgi:diguanylate cyclase (GGDEF)-like protein